MVNRDSAIYSKERLALLYQISQAFSSSLDLDEVLKKVMDEVVSATKAERGFIMLIDPEGGYKFRAARGIDKNTIEKPEFEMSSSVVAKATESRKPILTSDAQQDERFGDRKSVIDLNLRSVMAAPLIAQDTVLGAIYVDNRLRVGIFTESDLELLNAIASSAAIAIENARLYTAAVEKGRMERDLQVANRVQSSLIPQSMPRVKGWQFAGHWLPAKQVAGDFYDLIQLDDGRMGMLIADVVDKGVAAALFMAFCRSSLRACLAQAAAPKEGIRLANQLICADAAQSMFLTLAYAQIDPKTNEIIFVNAGHNPPLLLRSSKDEVIPLAPTGMLVGVEEDAAFEQASHTLDTGDFLFFYTDGVTEALNEDGEEFGEGRLNELLLANKKTSAKKLVANLWTSFESFIGKSPQLDDVTFVVAKRS